MIRGRISSEIQDLNILHTKYNWIPDENMIRPTNEILAHKHKFSQHILNQWRSFKDFILDVVFDYPSLGIEGKFCVDDTDIGEHWAFEKSLFPYNLPSGVNHWILWYATRDYFHEFDEFLVNDIIRKYLIEKVGSDSFDFAWYKNPKPSIPELWHIQVFWIRT